MIVVAFVTKLLDISSSMISFTNEEFTSFCINVSHFMRLSRLLMTIIVVLVVATTKEIIRAGYFCPIF